MKYLLNAFSLNMLKDAQEAQYLLYIKKLTPNEFCEKIRDSNIINAIGHQGTVELINQLCSTNFTVNRIEVHLEEKTNVLYIIQLMTRLPEGKVLSREELEKLLNEGKIKLLEVNIREVS